MPKLKDIGTVSGFYKAGDQGKLHYALSRCVVAESLSKHSKVQSLDNPKDKVSLADSALLQGDLAEQIRLARLALQTCVAPS